MQKLSRSNESAFLESVLKTADEVATHEDDYKTYKLESDSKKENTLSILTLSLDDSHGYFWSTVVINFDGKIICYDDEHKKFNDLKKQIETIEWNYSLRTYNQEYIHKKVNSIDEIKQILDKEAFLYQEVEQIVNKLK